MHFSETQYFLTNIITCQIFRIIDKISMRLKYLNRQIQIIIDFENNIFWFSIVSIWAIIKNLYNAQSIFFIIQQVCVLKFLN